MAKEPKPLTTGQVARGAREGGGGCGCEEGLVSGPVYLVILADGRSLDTDDYDRAVALMHEHPDAEWWCVDSFPAEDTAPKTLGGRGLPGLEL